MEKVDIINNIFKMIIITLYTYFVYIKITNYKDLNFSKVLIGLFSSLILSLIFSFVDLYINGLIMFPVICFVIGIIASYITKKPIGYCIITSVMAFCITYFIYWISVLFAGAVIVQLPFLHFAKRLISLLFISLIMFCILHLFFSLKRFKNGFNFLNNTENVSNIGMYALLFFGILLLLYGILKEMKIDFVSISICVGSILIVFVLIIWIKTQITKHYEDKMKIKALDILSDELHEKDESISKLKVENLKFSEIIHKYNRRFSALENSIINTLNSNFTTEASSELSIMLDDLKSISSKFSNEVQVANNSLHIPLTNVRSIDNIFNYMASQASDNNINFNLKVNDSILPLIDTIISKDDLETLIGDHLSDAIIAINSSNSSKRNIMCVLGIVDNCYEFSISDTGMDFEINTLLNLGLERITTHKDNGGSGIGFMTTFDTLHRCKGSLIIEEYNSKNSNYTKSIIFRFDGKCEYKIRSYRADKIRKQAKDNRIIIENLP